MFNRTLSVLIHAVFKDSPCLTEKNAITKRELKVISEGAHQPCKILELPVSEQLNAKITEARNRNGMAVVAFSLVWMPIIFSKAQECI